ncbi:MAG: hypothetical protein R2799_12960 [Crocinitomicaceae bacterium]
MSDLKRDLPKDVFKLETTSRLNMENEIMRQIDSIETRKVQPLGMRPQMMGVVMAIFFFALALFGVLADFSVSMENWSWNGWDLQKVFGKIPVELHITILVLSAVFLLYTIYRSIRDYSTSSIKS